MAPCCCCCCCCLHHAVLLPSRTALLSTRYLPNDLLASRLLQWCPVASSCLSRWPIQSNVFAHVIISCRGQVVSWLDDVSLYRVTMSCWCRYAWAVMSHCGVGHEICVCVRYTRLHGGVLTVSSACVHVSVCAVLLFHVYSMDTCHTMNESVLTGWSNVDLAACMLNELRYCLYSLLTMHDYAELSHPVVLACLYTLCINDWGQYVIHQLCMYCVIHNVCWDFYYNWKKCTERCRHCALVIVRRRSQKILPRRRPPSRGCRMAKI